MTTEEYDREEIMNELKKIAIGIAITSFIVYKFEIYQPLFIQAFLTPKGVLTNSLTRIHIFGEKPEGKLKRPFKPENPFEYTFFAFVLFKGPANFSTK